VREIVIDGEIHVATDPGACDMIGDGFRDLIGIDEVC
jgi:hypothetical protein